MSNQSTKRDANQAEIVATLLAAGCSVQDLHAVGSGCPDLLVGRVCGGIVGTRRCFLLEVKATKNAKGEPKPLTPDQVEWHRKWRGQVQIVTTPKEALRAVGITPMETP